MRGLPDAFAFKNGCMLAIETKAGKNTTTPQQDKFKEYFHKPPDRMYILARKIEDITNIL